MSPNFADAVGDWDDADWGWKDGDGGVGFDSQPKEASLAWLQECQVSVSPTGELIAIANDQRLVLMARKSMLTFLVLIFC